MILNSTLKRDEFLKMVIAQKDDEQYDESGWVAVVDGERAALAHYSHCSCYGTFEALCGGGIGDSFDEGEVNWDWTGTVDQLVEMARRKADPEMPTRVLSGEDYDDKWLSEVYDQILAWNITGRGAA